MEKREHILQFFTFEHLKSQELKDTSKLFADLAHQIDRTLPNNEEKTFALRKLMESKDCAVRCLLSKENES